MDPTVSQTPTPTPVPEPITPTSAPGPITPTPVSTSAPVPEPTMPVTEPTLMSEPTMLASEPMPAPAAVPEPVTTPLEPTPVPEPAAMPEPIPIPEPTATPEPVSIPEPASVEPIVPTPEPMPAPEPAFVPRQPLNINQIQQEPLTGKVPNLTNNFMTEPIVKPEPVNPVYQPTGNGVGATEPIMRPEPTSAPNPVEEELNAPMKAAGPAPGSIGSAISGTPSVAFNDPALQTAKDPFKQDTLAPAKKKTSKTTLIILIILALIVAGVLAAILIMQLMGGSGTSNVNNGSNSSNNASNNSGQNSTPAPVATTKTLSCVRNMTANELAAINDAASGTVSVSAEFDDQSSLASISLVKSVVYVDNDAASNEPVEMEVHEATAADLTENSALLFNLPSVEGGGLDLSYDSIQGNYESLDFTCEAL